MATAASLDGSRAIFQGRFDVNSVTRLLNIYAQRYVICPICNRPDTKMEKEGRFLFLKMRGLWRTVLNSAYIRKCNARERSLLQSLQGLKLSG